MNTATEIFTIWSDELENRLDPFFYQSYFKELEKQLGKSKYKLTKLAEICSAIRGVTYSSDDEAEVGTKILRANNITLATNEINLDDVRTIRADFPVEEEQRLKAGDILMSAASGSKEHVGKVAYFSEDSDFYFGSFMMVLRIKNEAVNAQYLFEFLSSKIFRGLLSRILGGTNINNLNFSMIENFQIPLPPLSVQTEVAKMAGKNRKKAKQLEEEARKILSSIDSYVLDELGIEIERERVSEGLEIYTIWNDEMVNERLDVEYHRPYYKSFYKALSNGKYKTMQIADLAAAVFQGVGKNETDDPSFTLLKVKNILRNNQIDLDDTEYVAEVPQSKVLQNDDILSPFIGQAVRQCKFSVFEQPTGTATLYVVDNNTGVIRADSNIVDPEYLASVLNSIIGKIQLEHFIGGGGVPFLGAANAEKLTIPLPSKTVQEKIASEVSKKRQKARALQTEAETIIEKAQQSVTDMILA